MSDSLQPSGSSLLEAPSPNEMNLLEQRLARMEEVLDAEALGWENDYRRKLLQEIEQRMQLRQIAFLVSGFVMVAMGAFAWGAFSVLANSIRGGQTGGASVVGMLVAPIVSITAITIVLVLGSFKRAKDEDDTKVNVPNLVVEAVKAART